MSLGLMSLFFGLGVGAWFYSQLAKRNGNASPSTNAVAAGFIALVITIIFFSVLKFIFHF